MLASLQSLREKIAHRQASLGVVGLGYVGLPVACAFADAGFNTVGVDVQAGRVARINVGDNPIEGNEPGLGDLLARVVASGKLKASTDYADLGDADIVTINVDTPVNDEDHLPRFEALKAACRDLGRVLKTGALVIVESTIAPGTMDRIVRPCLEEASGRQAGSGFFLGHCPERVMPGKLLANLRGLSRVVGGDSADVASVMVDFYRTVVQGDLDTTDLLTAELVKTAENAYRDVNIAFANQVALLAAQLGGDVWVVRQLVNKSPGRNMLLPGAGVGGHCIPKDPWLLASAIEGDRDSSLIATARRVNDRMPAEVARLVEECLSESGAAQGTPVIALLGYAYLEDSDDTRNSPTAALVPLLKERGYLVKIHDPFVPECEKDLDATLRGSDCAVLMVAHSPYRELNLRHALKLMRQPSFVDARGVFDLAALSDAGFTARRLGVGRRAQVARQA